jgi:UDP:flavonoid glycosyltransferase YjiC (YdhE family)
MVGGARDSIVALTTTPFLDPARGLPEHWRYVGPLSWSAPAEVGGLFPGRRERPLVYVTQGSTGDPRLLKQAVADLAGCPFDVVVTTGGLCDASELAELGPNINAAHLLPGTDCLAAADAAVIHGGHLTFCQALLAGTPFVMLPFRNDQIARLQRTERLGVGIGLYPRPRLPGTIRRSVTRLLEAPRYRRRSEQIAARLEKGWNGAANAADLAEQLASGSDLGEQLSERLTRA